MSNAKLDIHAKLTMSFIWKDDVQLPWWGMLTAFSLASSVALPLGVIQATTNQQPGYDVIAQFIVGYILPGKPIANLLFKIYGRITTAHTLSFLSDLKLAHYMKIPPRCMFLTQMVGTVVSATTNVGVAWWMLEGVENICDVDALQPDSPWTCPKYRVTFDSTVIWGLIGPRRLFGPGGLYRNLVWLFLIGLVLPVPFWVAKKFTFVFYFPEYAYSMKATNKSWVEKHLFTFVLFTMFGVEMDMVRWVEKHIEEDEGRWKEELIDPALVPLLPGEENAVFQLLEIALQCTKIVPQERPTSRQACDLLFSLFNNSMGYFRYIRSDIWHMDSTCHLFNGYCLNWMEKLNYKQV